MNAASGAWLPARRENRVVLLVELGRQHLRAHALVAALHRGGMLALALRGRLLVELARAKLREEAGFLDGALEAAKRHVEGLVFLDSDDRHLQMTLKRFGETENNIKF